MKTNILLALDSSESSINAARYVGNVLGNNQNVSVTLFHVLRCVPPELLESGSLQDVEELHRKKQAWEESQHDIECRCFDQIIEILKQAGFREKQFQTKHFAPLPGCDVANAIIEECEIGEYDTLVMGKRGLSRVGYFLIGSVTEKVVRHVKGMAVWVIE